MTALMATRWPLHVSELVGGHIEVGAHLCELLIAELTANARERRIHRRQPCVAGLLRDSISRVAHAKPGVATLLHVQSRSTPVLHEENHEVTSGRFEIVGVHRTEKFVALNHHVESFDESLKERLSADLVVESRIHDSTLEVVALD